MKAVVPGSMKATVERYRYSPGVLAGGLLFIAGQVGTDDDHRAIADPEQQYVAAFENVGLVLKEAGATFADVVDLTTFHTTLESFQLFAEVKSRFFTSAPYPAWTAIEISALALPGLLVEIKAIASRESG
jgi:enamine deaminase RidA (YjgF/YER057c/UK114 family)